MKHDMDDSLSGATHVEFEASFADGARFDDDGTLIVPGGKAIAVWLRAELSRIFKECSDVEQHEYYGWAFFVTPETRKLYCLLQQVGDKWLLICDASSGLFGIRCARGKRRLLELRELIVSASTVLRSDRRFSSVRVYPSGDYERAGSRDARKAL